MAYDGNVEKQGMSTQKKWLIGCGGCLGVVVLVAAVVAALAGLGFNALKDVSNQSVQSMFGKSFNPDPYMAMGLPLEQKNLRNMVMLLNQQRGITIIGMDTELSETEADVLKSGDPKDIEAYLKRMGAQATASSGGGSSQMRDVRFEGLTTVQLKNGKSFPLSRATVEAERRGTVSYSPAVAALLPQPDNRLVVLIALDPINAASKPDADLSHPQAALQTEVVRIVNDSELDDRLASAGAAQGKSAP
jgi:hypothetical protein